MVLKLVPTKLIYLGNSTMIGEKGVVQSEWPVAAEGGGKGGERGGGSIRSVGVDDRSGNRQRDDGYHSVRYISFTASFVHCFGPCVCRPSVVGGPWSVEGGQWSSV